MLGAVAHAQSVVATGLDQPFKIALTSTGNLLVSEGGKGSNTGAVSLVKRASGERTVLLSGLPSVYSESDGAIGITAMIQRERTLYLLAGEGDVVVSGATAGTQAPNPKVASSPIFSSLLAVRFSSNFEELITGFTMQLSDHVKLANGLVVELDNGSGAKATVELVANFPDVTPDANTNARASNPFGMTFDRTEPNILYVADSGQNQLRRVDVSTGRIRTVATFPPLPNRSGFGPPVSDFVPTSVRTYGDQLLVTHLTGFPFAAGSSGAYIVDPKTGAFQPWLTDRTMVVDIAVRERDGGSPQFFVLEYSLNLLAGQPGQLVQFNGNEPVVLQAGLVGPSGMVLDARTGEVFLTDPRGGRILKVDAQ